MHTLEAALLTGSWAQFIYHLFRRLGAFGLLFLGIMDSSFLFLPFGNDFLLIALVSTTRSLPTRILYVFMSALGSVIGVTLLDVVMRKAGEQGLEKFVKPNRIRKLKAKMDAHAGWAVFLATLIPPPFPFTAVVMTASALQTSRRKLLLTVFAGRLVRFAIEALLAAFFGQRLLAYINSAVLEYMVFGLIAIAIVGSILSVIKWVGSRKDTSGKKRAQQDEAA